MSIAVFTSFQQVCDTAGDPLNGGTVTVYQDGTTTPIQLYNDPDLAGGHETTNPITLDAYGRHAITYFATQAYKVLVKDFGGSTIFTRDNIDPGVPVGTGALPIANGGTGATDAATALANLGGATAAELADVTADVAAIAGTLGSVEITHLATGTTGQRPSSPIAGDVRRNTTLNTYEGYDGANWVNFVIQPTATTDPSATDTQEGLIELAVQSEQETGTDVVRAVTPGRQHFHPSAAKFWVKCGVAADVDRSYNVTSVADTAGGKITVTIANDFSDANYAVIANVLDSALHAATIDTQLAGSVVVSCFNTNTGGLIDPNGSKYYVVGFGDL